MKRTLYFAGRLRPILSLCLLLFLAETVTTAQNPYLPLWEFIPDGEPYVFEDPDCPGKYRVYIYGSHDSLLREYCGREQVVWSAPVEDLGNWRYDGIIFTSVLDRDGNPLRADGKGDVLYAPDVTMRIGPDGRKAYYLYPNNQGGGRNGMVARSDRPDGPFTVCNWSADNPAQTEGILGFDPAVFVDDDGRVYGYWGFERSYAAELDPQTMATVKPGTTIVEDMVPGRYQEGEFRFFEASSIRKIQGKYVFIFSRWTGEGEFGLPSVNYTLAYAYSDHPLGPWTYGGTIIDARGPQTEPDGTTICTANPFGNTHGSILQVGGEWWVFYHRQTGTDEYSRQAMVASIDVSVDTRPGGKVTISEGEYNSEGFSTGGLDPLRRIPAGLACYLTTPSPTLQDYPRFIFSGSYIEPTRFDADSYGGPFNGKIPFCPVVNNTGGSVVGYKYINLAPLEGASSLALSLRILREGTPGKISVMLGSPYTERGGMKIGEFTLDGTSGEGMEEISIPVSVGGNMGGKQALFFVFSSPVPGKSLCKLYDFMFIRKQ